MDLKYQPMQGSIITLSAHHNSWTTDKLGKRWMLRSIGWHSIIEKEANKQDLPACSMATELKSKGNKQHFHIICQMFSLQHPGGVLKNIEFLCFHDFYVI